MARATTQAGSTKPGSTRPAGPALDIDALLADPGKRIIVCCGSGGVGKTTTAAALGLRAAESGRRVVVLTIDPALRLAQSLGLTALDNTPRPVSGIDTSAGGSMDAMMLDMKRTFDEVVEQHATPEKAQQILSNPFYVAVSSSFAGTQEYMAMEKLGQLRAQSAADARWDLIVVDTPPSRSALDFLDAPKRLGSFLDGRFIRILMAPAKAGGRAYLKAATATISLAMTVMTRVLGGELLRDVQTFVAALDTMFGGFRERADQTYALLQDDETAFVVVASPDRDALREAAFFVERLATERMPLAGVVVNRVQMVAGALSRGRAEDAADALDAGSAASSASADLLRLHADLVTSADRHQGAIARFRTANPGVALTQVPTAARDIHDVEGLRTVGADLAG
ncbi:MAG: ArsA family ATPase [Actinobacteria bacterium]|nr:ArsA family ATPase [Actinomycetota bacterium]